VGDHSRRRADTGTYRTNRTSTGGEPTSPQGFSDEVSQRLGTAPVTAFANESVEFLEQRPFEGDANSRNGA